METTLELFTIAWFDAVLKSNQDTLAALEKSTLEQQASVYLIQGAIAMLQLQRQAVIDKETTLERTNTTD